MQLAPLSKILAILRASPGPRVEVIAPARNTGPHAGVLAASFNPVTIAHLELVRRAAQSFALDQTLALAGITNADKLEYGCSLEDRITMLNLAFEDDRRVSIGLSSHAFYVDMVEALERVYPSGTDLHFVVGFDTFERVLDRQDRYTNRYHRSFSNRGEALQYLLSRSRFIVAGRAGAGLQQFRLLLTDQPAWVGDRASFLDLPADLGERSATEVRSRLAKGLPIAGLVPAPVEKYIADRNLYRAS